MSSRRGLGATISADRDLYQRQIEATDRQIDALVYELYGLAEGDWGDGGAESLRLALVPRLTLGVMVGVVHRQTLGGGGAVQTIVSREKGEGWVALRREKLLRTKSCRQVGRVVGAQRMLLQ